MKEFHCSGCNKLLGKIEGKAEIKCPRCKKVNMTFERYAELVQRPGMRFPTPNVLGEYKKGESQDDR